MRRLLQSVLVMTAKPVIGGQAVVEGVMMRSPKSFAIAVRAPDGSIVVREDAWLSFATRLPFLKWPILRGATMLVESLYNGLLALSFSANTAMPVAPTTAGPATQDGAGKTTAKKSETDGLWLTLLMSMGFAFLLFKGVPHFSALFLGRLFGHDGHTALPTTSPLFHLVDGGIKLVLFVGYITAISQMKDVARLFMYHGAEHKSVHTYEAGVPLDVEHARTFSTAHPRCGTSLMLLVLATSMLVFAAVLPFVPVVFTNELAQAALLLVLKIPLLLPIAGLAYELQRAAAKSPNNLIVRALIAPGMLLQRLTTREPTDKELEVALAALRKTLWREKHADIVMLQPRSTVEVFENFDAVAKLVA